MLSLNTTRQAGITANWCGTKLTYNLHELRNAHPLVRSLLKSFGDAGLSLVSEDGVVVGDVRVAIAPPSFCKICAC